MNQLSIVSFFHDLLVRFSFEYNEEFEGLHVSGMLQRFNAMERNPDTLVDALGFLKGVFDSRFGKEVLAEIKAKIIDSQTALLDDEEDVYVTDDDAIDYLIDLLFVFSSEFDLSLIDESTYQSIHETIMRYCCKYS